MTPILAFDIETVPDIAGLRLLHGIEAQISDHDVAEFAFRERRARTGHDFLPLHQHRVVAIACALRDEDSFRCWSLGSAEEGEAVLIRRFFDGIEKYTPQLVSWNGGGFDLPVLHYRSLVHGVSAPRYWEQGDEDKDFRYNNYLNRFHMRHVDLMDVLSLYQNRGQAPLDEVARLLGFPGKLGMDGSKVWEAYQSGKIDDIRKYCETDVANTYLVFQRFQLLRGACEDALWHIARVHAETLMRPLQGLSWGYRHRARLSVRWVPKKGGSLVGFRERKSRYVTDMTSCEVLPPRISDLLRPLRALVDSLDMQGRLPQIEVAVGEEQVVLVFRVLVSPGAADAGRLRQFAERHGVHLWLQPAGPDSARPFWPLATPGLYYALPEYGLRIAFGPTDFTQVNHAVSRLLVVRALSLLDPRPGERIADFFCGLGNFTLPIAGRGAEVLGVEGSSGLVARAQENARANGLADRCRFAIADLFDAAACAGLPACDKVLLDPPREGAIELVKSFAAKPPSRIVYVACDPATLARDSGVLVHVQGSRLAAAGVVNMFPHTSHVESIALFDRDR